MAVSTASDPDDVKNTRPSVSGDSERTRSANASGTSLVIGSKQ